MTQEEHAIILELYETKVNCYRECAEKITRNSLTSGYTIPWGAPEGSYSAQVHTAWLCYVVLSQLRPVFDALYKEGIRSPVMKRHFDRIFAEAGVDLSIDDIPEFVVSLTGYVSEAATANGLPPCQYYQESVS